MTWEWIKEDSVAAEELAASDTQGIAGPLFHATRIAACLSLQYMANRLGETEIAIDEFERGKITPPKHRLRAFFRVLGEEAAAQSDGAPSPFEVGGTVRIKRAGRITGWTGAATRPGARFADVSWDDDTKSVVHENQLVRAFAASPKEDKPNV